MILCKTATKTIDAILEKFPGNYLEIGVFEGESLAHLALKHPDRKFYGVDPFIEDGYTREFTGKQTGQPLSSQYETALKNLVHLSNVTLFKETSANFATRSDAFLTSLEVAWVLIDGSHWKEDVKIDTELAMRLIGKKQGAVILDDVDFPEVRESYEVWCKRYAQILAPALDLNPVQPGHLLMHGVYAR